MLTTTQNISTQEDPHITSDNNQKAILLTQINGPLTLGTLPIPNEADLKPTELIIKVTAAGLAPFDQKLRDQNIFNIGNRLPAVLASDLVGIVYKSGSASTFPIGSLVFAQQLHTNAIGGGLQEYTVIDGSYTGLLPSTVSDLEAALYPSNAVTVAYALFSSDGFGWPLPETQAARSYDFTKEKVVIVGGGYTGKLAVQLANLAGVGTIIVIASERSEIELKEFGASHVIHRQAENVEDQVRTIVGDELLFVYDTVAKGEDHGLGVSLLSNTQKGTFVHNLSGKAREEVMANKKAGIEYRMLFGVSAKIPEFGRLLWKQIPMWLEEAKLKPSSFKTIEGLDAAQVNRVLDAYKEGKAVERHHVRVI